MDFDEGFRASGGEEGNEVSGTVIGIYVEETVEGLPPRASFLVEIAPGLQGQIGGVAYTDGAWRYPNGEQVEEQLGDAITEHAESLGVEWDH